MYMINRCVAVVKGKLPFLKWIGRLPDPLAGLTLDDLRRDCHAYLSPEYDTDQEQLELLKDVYEVIFEEELMGWCTDPETHPTSRTFKMFQEWFEVEFHSVVIDMVEDDIEHEPM